MNTLVSPSGDALVAATDAPNAIHTLHVPRRFVRETWGGTETTVLESARALQRAGHPAAIHTSMAMADRSREAIDGIAVKRFQYCYPYWGLDAAAHEAMDHKGGNLLSLPLLWSLLHTPNVSLLHAHAGKRLGATVRTAARLRGIPYVITLHGGFFDIPEQQRAQLAAPTQNGFEWGRIAGALLGSRRVLSDADAVLCVGDNEYRAACEALPDTRVEKLPNGVDCDHFSRGEGRRFRARYGIPEQRRIILCVSRIDEQKNQLALIDALPALLAREPDTHLALIGPVTSNTYYERLQRRLSDSGLADHVTLIPGLGAREPLLQAAYQAAEIFCLPSQHEPFGIVILEAWAAGLPVVASNIGGIPSFTEAGEDCLHIDPNQPQSIVSAASQLLEQPNLRARLAARGLVKARQDYDWSVIGERLIALYRDLIRHGRRG